MEKFLFIIYVKDQRRSKEFYSNVLHLKPVLDVEGMTEFEINSNATLGIMPEPGIAKILGTGVPHPETGNGIPRCEIYLTVKEPETYLDRLVSSGGKLIGSVELRSWGDETGYGADPDGHILAFAKKK